MKLSVALFALTTLVSIPLTARAGEEYRVDQINGVWYRIPESAKAGVDFARDKDRPWVIKVLPGSKITPLAPAKVGQNASPDPLGIFGESRAAKAVPSFQFAFDNSLGGGAGSAR